MSQGNEQVADVMSKKLITVRLEDSVRTAYQIMQDRKIRHLPVCDDQGTVIGILSDRDLQRAMTPNSGEDPEFDEDFEAQDFMAWPVQTITPDVSIEAVALKMLNEKMSALLVVGSGADHGPKGIITTDDLLKLLVKLLQNEPERLVLKLESILDDIGFSSAHWA